MRYINASQSLIINAYGGYRVLEKLGFKPVREFDEGKEDKKEKLKRFIESMPVIDKVCPICKNPFQTKNPKQKTDSRRCGQKYRRQNK